MKIINENAKLTSVRCAGLITKPEDTTLGELYFTIKQTLLKHGVELLVDENSAKNLECEGVPFDLMCTRSDFLISLGGDGTLISLSRRSFYYNKPILGIYAGQLGFLTDIKSENIEDFLGKFFSGNYRVDERMMLEISLHVENTMVKLVAFNDAVFVRDNITTMSTVEAFVDGQMINSYRGDGLIVSTPTGSTAYNINTIIYTSKISKQLKLDLEKYNSQYKKIELKKFDLSHDRFLIIDDKEVYHIGASLKDLGKKMVCLFKDGHKFF